VRWLRLILLALLLAPSVAQAEPVPLTVWHSYGGAERATFDRVLADIRRQHADWRITAVPVPYDAFADKLTAALGVGNGPDVFLYPGHDRLGEWAAQGLAEPLDERLTPELSDRFVAVALRALRYPQDGGQLYGLPVALKSLALVYDPQLWPIAPTSLEQLQQATQRQRQLGRYGVVFDWGNTYSVAAVLHAFGGGLLDAQGRPQLDHPGNVVALRWLRGWRQQELVPREISGAMVQSMVNDGRAAAALLGPWSLRDLTAGKTWTVAPVPPGPAGPAQPYLGVEAAVLARNSPHKPEAFALVTALTSDDAANRRLTESATPVANRAPWTQASDPRLRGFLQQAEQATPMPNAPAMRHVWLPMDAALAKVVGRGEPPEVALAEAQRRVREAVAATERAEQEAQVPDPLKPLWPWLGGLVSLLLALGLVLTRARWWPHLNAYAYVAPAVVGVAVLVLVPFAFGLSLSLYEATPTRSSFVGLRHFVDIVLARGAGDAHSFWYTLAMTVVWTLANVVLHVGIGLGLALLLQDPALRFRRLYRVLLIVPWAVPNYITALIWKAMFNAEFGLINRLFGLGNYSWFEHPLSAFCANLATNVWLGFPFMMVTSLGALQAIPKELYEAADMDGAGRWRKFIDVTLPLLKPALVPAVILGAIWTFNLSFNVIYLVSGGAPDGATDILVTQAFRYAFEQYRYGYAAAYATLIFLLLLSYTVLTNRITRATEGAFE
jgi:arabinogalactan oligomer/maltooligosaccharide transport system permease protein